MLNTQYRMHPDISYFPSINFYEGALAFFQEFGFMEFWVVGLGVDEFGALRMG